MFRPGSTLVTNIFKHLLCTEPQQKETQPENEDALPSDRGEVTDYSTNSAGLRERGDGCEWGGGGAHRLARRWNKDGHI